MLLFNFNSHTATPLLFITLPSPNCLGGKTHKNIESLLGSWSIATYITVKGSMEVEDDLFFADLSRQISLLIMDDDEVPVATCPSVSLQAFSRANYPTIPTPFFYEQSCLRESKGTGVFIPQSTQPRRKSKQGRFNSKSQNRQHQHDHKTRTVSSQPAYNTHSLNSKKG